MTSRLRPTLPDQDGASSRTDRTENNRLLRIEDQLGSAAVYAGKNAFGKIGKRIL
ncbi:MAG: hypothetical protein R2881_06715 [Eubacteriales bacterium]